MNFDEEQVARVARALCETDGQDPRPTSRLGRAVVDEGDGGERYHEVTAPAWTTYAGEARRMIAAVKAMGLLGQGLRPSSRDLAHAQPVWRFRLHRPGAALRQATASVR